MTKVNENRQVKVGCCGFAAVHKKYFELFKVVEIQQTFYQIAEIKTAEKWRHAAPPDFEFTMKAWQLITHVPSSPRQETTSVMFNNSTMKEDALRFMKVLNASSRGMALQAIFRTALKNP